MGFPGWSLKVGRIFGITIRLHLVLILFLAAQFLSWAFVFHSPWMFLVDSVTLFLIILLHEFGHCFAARSVGGRAEEVLLWPLGGLAFVDAPNTANAQLKTAIGGPAVNVLLGLLLGGLVLALGAPFSLGFGGWYDIMGNRFPFVAEWFRKNHSITLTWFQIWLIHTFSMNLSLLLFNLLPAFPLDGGRILQCLLWPKIGFGEATLRAIFFGNLCAVGLAIFGIFSEDFLMLVLALFIYGQGAQMRQLLQEGSLQDESLFGYDFSQGYTSFEASEPKAEKLKKPGFFQKWAMQRQQKKIDKERKEAEEINRRVDELLGKVSKGGLHSLTERERRFLRDASKKYKR